MSRRARILLIFMSLLALSVLVLVNKLRVSSDISMFLPQGANWSQRVLVEELRKGANGKLVLIALQGGSRPQQLEVSHKLAKSLKSSKHFFYVNNGASGLPAQDRELIRKYRYVLSPAVTAERYTTEGLSLTLQQRLADLASVAAPVIKPYLADDPYLDRLAILQQWSGERSIRKSGGIWFSKDGKRPLLLAYTRAEASDLDRQQAAAGFIRSQFAEHAVAGMRLQMSGPAMIAVNTRDEIRSDTQLLSAIASAVAILFLFAAFRSMRVVLLGIVPLMSGALVGLAVTASTYNEVHGIAIAFGVTLIGIAIDYPMHYFSHAGVGLGGPETAIQRIWPTLRLGMLTTLTGFMALVFGGYGGLTQLGLFSMAGLAVAALVTRFVLPVLTPFNFTLEPSLVAVHRLLSQLASRAVVLRYPVLVLLALAAVAVFSLGDSLWQNDPSRMAPLSDAVRKLDDDLRKDLDAPFVQDLLLVSAPDQEQLLQKLERLQPALERAAGQGQITSYDMASRYLPSRHLQQQRIQALPDIEQLDTALKAATRQTAFHPGLFRPFVDAVARAKSSQPIGLDDFNNTLLSERLALLMFAHEGTWVASVPLLGVNDPGAIKHIADTAGEQVVYVQTREQSQQMMSRYRQRALQVFAYGAVAIFIVLVIGLTSVWTAVRVLMVPLSVVLLTMPLIYYLVEGGLGLFHLVALLLVIGLGIDYALFFNRLAGNQDEWGSTFPALWKSWLTTVLVFGSLAFSHAVVLQAIGLTVSVGVSLCFIMGAVWMRRGLVMRPFN